MNVEDLKQRASDAFASVEIELQQTSEWMYDNPELAFQEHESSARLVDILGRNGFDVEYPAYGIETAFAARAGTSGPEMVICAEYDALPGIGHACGHNIIATAAVGAGIGLAEMADELGFRITVLGTPAEELMGGKVDLINAGAFEGATASMMIHPAPGDVLDPVILAVVHLDIQFHGKDAHASLAPQEGINALDAFVQAYVNISTLRQHLHPSDRIHGIITKGGDAANIIPSHTASTWYVRAQTQERLDELVVRVRACFDAAATATGCTWEMEQAGHGYSDLRSNPVLADLFFENAAALGRTMLRREDLPPGASGSTDMGNVSHIVPAIHPFLSINCAPAVNHQPEFAAHTITDDGTRTIRDGALAMAWTTIDVAAGDRWHEL